MSSPQETNELTWVLLIALVALLYLLDLLDKHAAALRHLSELRRNEISILAKKPQRVALLCGDEHVEYVRADSITNSLLPQNKP